MSTAEVLMSARAANIRLGQSGPIGPAAYRMENGGRGVAAHTYPCLARPHEAIRSLC